ncbi:MAG TPA: hypothetical protein VJC12_00060 [Candidatus Paceibacterota bacterium]
MSFWENKTQSKLSVICDIGSTRIAAALVLLKKEENPKILHQTEVRIPVQEIPNKVELQNQIFKSAESALKAISYEIHQNNEFTKLSDKKIDNVYIFFSASWHISYLKELNLIDNKEFVLDKKFINKILDEEEKKFKSTISEGKERFSFEKEFKVIERNFLKIRLNGYETGDPYMKKATEANFSLYLSAVPFATEKKIHELVTQYLNTQSFRDFTFVYSALWTLRKIFPHNDNLLLINFTSETTEIAIESPHIALIEIIDFGRNELIRRIAHASKTSVDIADSYLEMFKKGILDDKAAGLVRFETEMYFKEFRNKLDQIISKHDLGGVSFKGFLLTNEFSGFIKIIFQNSYNIADFSEKLLSDKISLAKGVPSEAAMYIETYFIAQMEDGV